jgi:hypothetical protein
MMDAHYQQFFAEAGYEVAELRRIEFTSTLALATVDETMIRPVLMELAESGWRRSYRWERTSSWPVWPTRRNAG